jgi:hypothetical protein
MASQLAGYPKVAMRGMPIRRTHAKHADMHWTKASRILKHSVTLKGLMLFTVIARGPCRA